MHLIFFRYDETADSYYPIQAGKDIVPTDVIDKVVPVERHISRQFEKVYYKDGKLKVRDGMKLLSNKELDEVDLQSIADVGVPFNMEENNIVEVSE